MCVGVNGRTLHFLNYTSLINELLKRIAQAPSFEEWCQEGTILLEVVEKFCKQLREIPQFSGQPGQFYSSAEETEEVLDQCAIAYLLKNGCKLPDEPEDDQKFVKRRRRTEIRARRLVDTLQRTRLPKGRAVLPQRWLLFSPPTKEESTPTF